MSDHDPRLHDCGELTCCECGSCDHCCHTCPTFEAPFSYDSMTGFREDNEPAEEAEE